ncbi:4'-phosphopantetheinyl transferase family protein [Streptomyces sp. NBC_01465]|uniref:4'-phosphopantetheinyl transferase family protein n=1 Tax=Streptomyces sp. NBC_01465 TaxID=2903878 RepID=UPI002E301C4A|nr:4'-phosphopantetheinyl transferase superfamily protein [Streptomyces sp. NBC_01465]
MSILTAPGDRAAPPAPRREALMARLLPPQVVTVESFGPWQGDWRHVLHPAEARVVAAAGEKRRQDFASVRECARRAMRTLGVPPAPLLPGPRGEPGWPPGTVGAMTHCTGYRAAALARAGAGIAAVGIDAEPHARLSADVLEMVAGRREQDRLTALDGLWPQVSWGCLLFSVKEAVFKAWYPLALSELGFLEAEVDLWPDPGDCRTGGFTVEVTRPGPFASLAGRWRLAQGLVATATAVAASAVTETPAVSPVSATTSGYDSAIGPPARSPAILPPLLWPIGPLLKG